MKTNTKIKQSRALRSICVIAILSALSAVIHLIQFPVFFAPPFYKLDFSEAVVLIGGFAFGPGAAVLIELLKNLLNMLLDGGSTTAYVGEFSNFVMGCMLTVPAALLYRIKRTRKGALLGMLVGIVMLTVSAALLNYFVMIPLYSKLYGMELSKIIAMGTALNPLVTDLPTLIALAVVPFNLLKGLLNAILTFLLYKRLSRFLH